MAFKETRSAGKRSVGFQRAKRLKGAGKRL